MNSLLDYLKKMICRCHASTFRLFSTIKFFKNELNINQNGH